MQAYLLSDGEYAGETLEQLDALLKQYLESKRFTIAERRLKPQELDYCMGCFGCWIKTPGECVIKDAMAEINRDINASDVVIYLVPVVFGQYSANIKNALDRWIPNILPFFYTKKDGKTMHPKRYESNPQYLMIGYGDGLTQDDQQLFTDITANHRENGTVLFYEGDSAKLQRELDEISLQRTEGAL